MVAVGGPDDLGGRGTQATQGPVNGGVVCQGEPVRRSGEAQTGVAPAFPRARRSSRPGANNPPCSS
jgi:hypothetical protein